MARTSQAQAYAHSSRIYINSLVRHCRRVVCVPFFIKILSHISWFLASILVRTTHKHSFDVRRWNHKVRVNCLRCGSGFVMPILSAIACTTVGGRRKIKRQKTGGSRTPSASHAHTIIIINVRCEKFSTYSK